MLTSCSQECKSSLQDSKGFCLSSFVDIKYLLLENNFKHPTLNRSCGSVRLVCRLQAAAVASPLAVVFSTRPEEWR